MSSKTKNIQPTPGKFQMPSVVQLENHKVPIFKEVRGEEWIQLGEKNDYAWYLIQLYDRSAKHAAIVKAKVNYTTGAGWDYDKENLTPQQLIALNQFMKRMNPDGESLKDVSMKCDEDKKIFGGFYLEVIWDKMGKKPASIKHIPFRKMRSNMDNTTFFYSEKWLDKNGKMNRLVKLDGDYKVYPAFDPFNATGAQILFYKTYHPALDVYPLPEYLGAISNIETDIEISNYHYNNVKNQFAGTFMVNFLNGMPTAEEQRDIERKFKEKFTGTDNAGSFVLNFADGKEKAAEILPIGMSNADKMFMELTKWVQEEIFTGHRITSPMLFGIKTEGQLGGRSEIVEAYELFKNTYVKPEQLQLESVFNMLAKYSGLNNRLFLKESEPISEQLSENALMQILTVGELRIKAGYPEQKPVEINATPAGMNKYSKFKVDQEELSACISEHISAGKDQDQAVAICISIQEQKNSKILPIFEKYGTPKDQFNVLNKKYLHHFNREMSLESELSIAKGYFYTSNERAIIDLLSKDALMPIENIAQTLKISTDRVVEILKNLTDNGLLKPGTSDMGLPINEVTPEAQNILDENPAKTAEIIVMYSYDWAPGFNQGMIDTSRTFCKDLLNLDKLYTRDEIESISAETGRDVWSMRGGWYTKPGTTIHIPHCRHLWQQNIVTKK